MVNRPETFTLLYVSRVAVSVALALTKTMQDILVVSDANNRRDDITGFLLSDGHVFVQLLEGPETAVRACLARIARDPRNLPPIIRDEARSSARLFPRWSMCALNLSGRDNALLRPGDLGFDLSSAAPGALRQHLLTMARAHGNDLLQAHAPLLGRATDGDR